MARYPRAEPAIEAAARWRDHCLIEDGSVFSDASVWTRENLQQLDEYFIQNPDESDDSFYTKLQRQLEPSSPGARRLAAEMLWVLYLFPDNIGAERKLENLQTAWEWTGMPFPAGHDAMRAVESGVGSGGPGFLMHQWKEFAFLITIVAALKHEPLEARRSKFGDPWEFARWVDGFPELGNRQLRHVLRFLLFPDHFERIASGNDKRRIVHAFAPGLSKEELRRLNHDLVAVDQRLLEIREAEEKRNPGAPLDFYEPPLVEVWRTKEEETLRLDPAALEHLRECFLYHYPEFETFASDERLHIHERAYKDELAARFHEALDDVETSEAIGQESADEIVEAVRDVLTGSLPPYNVPQNLVTWRYFEFLRTLDEGGRLAFARALAELIAGDGPGADRIERFNGELWTLLQRTGPAIPAVSRSIPTLFLMLAEPEEHIFIRTEPFDAIAQQLTGSRLFDDKPLDGEQYQRALRLTRAIRDQLVRWGWRPRDMVDVQTFMWVADLSPKSVPAGLQPWPRRRVVKIAPGEQARLWDECRQGGFIAIGWDELGDLRQYPDRAAIFEALRSTTEKHPPALGADASELQTFRSLEPGDIVVANRGRSEIVGIGIVQSPGYHHDPDRTEYRNVVPVRWYASLARRIPQQATTWNRTVVELSRDEYAALFTGSGSEEATDERTFDELQSRIRAEGFYFPGEVVANYLLALQTKRFVILTGISGTGKTRLAMHVARFFGAANSAGASVDGDDAGGYRVVAVRPDWTDNRALLGYYNPIAERYTATDFLRFLLRARHAYDEAKAEGRLVPPYFLILDEMNLARVEHYFSDFLSALESDEPLVLHGEATVAAGDTGEPIPGEVRVPPNLFITGTVNVDETTFMFSPKVLDRAFTIELNDVDLARFSMLGPAPDAPEPADESPLALRGLAGSLAPVKRHPDASDWDHLGDLAEGTLQRCVIELNDLLDGTGRNFGYRVAAEIARFVGLAVKLAGDDAGAVAAWIALDLAILQKVLPKFHGTQQELEAVLRRLFVYAVTGSPNGMAGTEPPSEPERDWSFRGGRLVRASENAEPLPREPQFPRTAAKLWRMLRRLSERGFTSFIE